MNKALEIFHRILVNDPIAVVLILLMCGLWFSANQDFRQIRKISEDTLKKYGGDTHEE